MVAYLQKPEGSEEFHQIVDFLNTIHIRYALTKNPTIYVSLIQQFWKTATTRTLDNGEMEITATIDGKVKVVTMASVRRHLKLEDSDGISILPTIEIFEQFALMRYVSNSDKLTFQKGHFSPQWKFLIHTIIYCLSSKKTAWEQFNSNIATALICLATNRTFNFSKMIFDGMVKNLDSKHKFLIYPRFIQGEGSTVPVESHHTPTGASSTSQPHLLSPLRSSIRQETKVPQPSSPTRTHVADEAASIGVDVRHGGAATTITSLDAGHGTGNIDKTSSMPYDSPLLRVNILRSDEDRLQHNELMDLVTKLSDKVLALETDLKQTNKVYGVAYTKLIIKVNKLENTIMTSQAKRKAKIIMSNKEVDLEDPSKQGRIIEEIDQDTEVSLVTPTQTYTRRRSVSTGSGGVSTASRMISTAEESVSTAGASMPVSTTGMIDKEDEWENIRARVKADEELTQRLQVEERNKYNEVDQAKMLVDLINQRKRYFVEQKAKAKRKNPMTQAQQRTYISSYIKYMGSYTLKQLKKLSFDEIKELFKATMRSINDFVPMKSEDDKVVPKLAEARSSTRDAEKELDQGRSKKQKIGESSEPRNKYVDELSQGELQQLMIIVPE
nr:synaptobrevin, longin-like domain protein [Tanacetum cinerariifolium]